MCSVTWVLIITVAILQLMLYNRLKGSLTLPGSTPLHIGQRKHDGLIISTPLCPALCECGAVNITCSLVGLAELPKGTWKNVENMKLNYNVIIEVPKDISLRFPQLKKLDMTMNELTQLDLGTFVGYNGVSRELVLIMTVNTIATIVPPPPGTLVQALSILDLSYNKLTYLDKDAFQAAINLKMIWLDHNPLKIPWDRPVVSSSSLKFLSLGNIDANLLSENTFTELPSLTNLLLSHANVHNVTKVFSPLHSLTTLDLSGNNITEVNVSSFSPKCQLAWLDLSGNPLHNLEPMLPMGEHGLLSIMDTPVACACAQADMVSWTVKRGIILRDYCKGLSCLDKGEHDL